MNSPSRSVGPQDASAPFPPPFGLPCVVSSLARSLSPSCLRRPAFLHSSWPPLPCVASSLACSLGPLSARPSPPASLRSFAPRGALHGRATQPSLLWAGVRRGSWLSVACDQVMHALALDGTEVCRAAGPSCMRQVVRALPVGLGEGLGSPQQWCLHGVHGVEWRGGRWRRTAGSTDPGWVAPLARFQRTDGRGLTLAWRSE